MFWPISISGQIPFHIHLDTDHHAIGHPFRPGIVVPRILQICHILSRLMINPLLFRAIEKGMDTFLQLSLYFFPAFSQFPENIPVLSRLISAHFALSFLSASYDISFIDCSSCIRYTFRQKRLQRPLLVSVPDGGGAHEPYPICGIRCRAQSGLCF